MRLGDPFTQDQYRRGGLDATHRAGAGPEAATGGVRPGRRAGNVNTDLFPKDEYGVAVRWLTRVGARVQTAGRRQGAPDGGG